MPMRDIFRHLPISHLFATSTFVSTSQERDRSKIPDEYKWDLGAIYASDQAWREQKEKLASELPQFATFQGTLGSSASKMAEVLELLSRLEKELTRLFLYASLSWIRTRE